jgi:hypothetical protein
VIAVADPAPRVRRLFARAAMAAAALTFVVIVASAFIRHAQLASETAGIALPALAVRFARIAHRISAAGVLALIVGLNLIAWTQRPRWTTEGVLAAIAIALTAGLAALGIATPGARLAAVTPGNLLGGHLLFMTLAATAAVATEGSTPRGVLPRALALAAAGLVLFAAALAPWSDVAPVSVLHRVVGIAVATAAGVVAWRLRVDARRLAGSLALLVVATPSTGIIVTLSASIPAAIVHNACSALLGATLAVAAARPRRDSPS